MAPTTSMVQSETSLSHRPYYMDETSIVFQLHNNNLAIISLDNLKTLLGASCLQIV